MLESNITEKTHVQPVWMTILRILLGLILAYKGISFLRDSALVQQLIDTTGIGIFTNNTAVLSYLVCYLNLLGGIFIACGLFTRISSIVQIPILIIAVFFINISRFPENSFETILSIVTLVLLILFAIKGSGTISGDEFFRTYYKAGTEDGQTKRFFQS